MIQQGVGYTVTNSSGGQSLVVDFPRPEITQAFFVYEDIKDDASETIFRVTPGTINNQLPTINGVQIGLADAFLAAPTANAMVVLTIPNSPTAYPSAQSTISIMPSPPDNTPTASYLSLASIQVERLPLAGSGKSYQVSNLLRGSVNSSRFIEPTTGDTIYLFFGI
jgi:hypothetical protein